MHLYLFGGTGPSNYLKQWEDTFSILDKIKPKELLFIPFASGKDTYVPYCVKLLKSKLASTIFLDARNNDDIEKAVTPLVFVIGGHDHVGLFQSVTQNKKIEGLIKNCDYFIGESAGAMIAGSLQRKDQSPNSPLMEGLGLLSDTIIEPHYTERNRHELLREEMKQSRLKYGIGIDEATGIHVDLSTYPNTWDKIGEGRVELLENNRRS